MPGGTTTERVEKRQVVTEECKGTPMTSVVAKDGCQKPKAHGARRRTTIAVVSG